MSKETIILQQVSKCFESSKPPALDDISADVCAGSITGLVGPDGSGKTTLIRMIAGLLKPTSGTINVFGLDSIKQAGAIQRDISYMPQRFGLYEDLSVEENLNLYGVLHNVNASSYHASSERLLKLTALLPFRKRLAGDLSGGMKQKLGIACSLIEKPKLLLLDEPSVGVDPISRREIWNLVKSLTDQSMAVIWSTAYLDEAEKCDSVLLLNEGKLLFKGPPDQLTQRTLKRTFVIKNMTGSKRQILQKLLDHPGIVDGVIQGENIRLVLAKDESASMLTQIPELKQAQIDSVAPRFEDSFIDMLGGTESGHSKLVEKMPVQELPSVEEVVQAVHLTKKFGDFIAANDINFSIRSGEIFGLLGPNGAGKSTTFKMMCGLLQPTSGTAKVSGLSLQSAPGQARAQIGYMAQKFSLYGNLSVIQNLSFFAGVYGVYGRKRQEAFDRMIQTFALKPYLGTSSEALPLGFKQRLALACSILHHPDVLFLDEPTSGVDPLTRREFWTHINGMVENGVTVMVTTHFMEEAEYCDRIGLVYKGQIIAMGQPEELIRRASTQELPSPSMEDAFIKLIEDFDRQSQAVTQ
jgi:ABC-2 type transport system ATP-binding protein